jgi:DNA-binding transcriptional LysR family regulator
MNEIDLRRLDLNLLVTFEVLMAERSVTRAAARLGRTQSAISHSLARLREQLGDPLLVKVGGRMSASPFAETMIAEVRPILRSIQRVLAAPQPFDPASSTRTFRIAIPDLGLSLFAQLMARVRRTAPGLVLEWIAPGAQTLLSVAEGQIDIALVPSAIAVAEGIEHQDAGELKWATFARKDHPAIASWGVAAWTRWPHVVVQVGDRLQSPVVEAAAQIARKRTVAAWVPNFSAVPPLLAHTDLLATLPTIVMCESMDRFGLCALPSPIPVRPMPHRFVWSLRLAGDPAIRWLREQLAQVFAEALRHSELPRPRQRRLRTRHGSKHGASGRAH